MNTPPALWKPELLAPAKNLERLQVAVTYGADAVYVGGQSYGLRARADNFSHEDLRQGVAFAHRHNARVYVTLNAFLHDDDFAGLPEYCQFLEAIGVDAVIVSDLGVIRTLRQCSTLTIHLSTQASCLNAYAAQLWKQTGIQRLIVGREVSIADAHAIHAETGLEVEMFIHGAMCMAYSGHCTISNFTAGRDSNRGGCIQSCRLPYQLEPLAPQPADTSPEPELVTFMSSRDLWGIHQIPAFFHHQICSLKIEGRMKSSFYVAMTCKVYRRLIDAYADGVLTPALLDWATAELQSVPHRDYCSGSLETPAGPNSVFEQLAGVNVGTHHYLGLVVDTTADDVVVHLMEPLAVGDEIEVIAAHTHKPLRWQVTQMTSIVGEPRSSMRQDSLVRLPKYTLSGSPSREEALTKFSLVRKAHSLLPVSHAV